MYLKQQPAMEKLIKNSSLKKLNKSDIQVIKGGTFGQAYDDGRWARTTVPTLIFSLSDT